MRNLRISFKKILFVLLILAYSVELARAGDEDWINTELQANTGGVYTLPAGTYTISNQIIVPEGTTIQGEVSESGEWLSTISPC